MRARAANARRIALGTLGFRQSRVAQWLIACALLVRVLLPAGVMPAVGGDGAVRIAICDGSGGASVWLDRDGTLHDTQPPHNENDGAAADCAFALTAAASTLPGAPAIVTAAPRAATQRPVPLQTSAVGHGLAAPPPPPTGPPALI